MSYTNLCQHKQSDTLTTTKETKKTKKNQKKEENEKVETNDVLRKIYIYSVYIG